MISTGQPERQDGRQQTGSLAVEKPQLTRRPPSVPLGRADGAQLTECVCRGIGILRCYCLIRTVCDTAYAIRDRSKHERACGLVLGSDRGRAVLPIAARSADSSPAWASIDQGSMRSATDDHRPILLGPEYGQRTRRVSLEPGVPPPSHSIPAA